MIFSIDRMLNKKESIYLAMKYYNTIIDTSQIENIGSKYESASMITDYGKVLIWAINIQGQYLSEATPEKVFVIYSKDKREAIFFPFSDLVLLKRKMSDTTSIIGGIEISKGVGYFLAYSYMDTSFIKIFDSGFDIPDSTLAVPVYLNDGGCIRYSEDFLQLRNIDINNDSLLDISFAGTILYYCKPNEYGIDTNKRSPINRKKITINYILRGSDNKLKYVLMDTAQIKEDLYVQ
jgi:hypothetical protein